MTDLKNLGKLFSRCTNRDVRSSFNVLDVDPAGYVPAPVSRRMLRLVKGNSDYVSSY